MPTSSLTRGGRLAPADGLYDLTSGDLARMLGVDLKTIHNWVNHGHIVGRRTEGRHLRFRRTEVVRFLRRFGHPVPGFIGTAPVRVLVSKPKQRKMKPLVLGRGIAQAACDGLFAATLELATGHHEILVVDLDSHGLPHVTDMMEALRSRTSTSGIPMIGLSRNTAHRRAFVAHGGEAALVQSAADLGATVRWMAGGTESRPAGVTIP